MRYVGASEKSAIMPFGALFPFLLIAFGLAWGIVALILLYSDVMVRIFGEVSATNPLFILAVYAPAIGAVSLVYIRGGVIRLGRFLSRLFLWRCSAWWYAFLLFGIPLLFAAGAALNGGGWQVPAGGIGPLIATMAFMLILGPVEEIGWRGLALPLLQRRMAPIWAGIVLGVIWGVWHLPAFLLSGTPQSAWSFGPFFVGAIALSVIITPMFNAARGSILLPVLFHFQLNNPLWPDVQPYDNWLFALAAVVVVWLNRDTMFTRDGAVTRVVPLPR
jgi:membrane protease YdiL (CAAX protease family)